MKLYTRRGDDGGTELFGGQRTPKHALRIETVGSVDELNSALGLATSVCEEQTDSQSRQLLSVIQSRLFEVGADLATPLKSEGNEPGHIPRMDHESTQSLETQIDRIDNQLQPLQYFILPGGCELASRLHDARTTCRRAERRAAQLAEHERLSPGIIAYLNRLGDLLFALARLANHHRQIPDIPWQAPTTSRPNQ